MKKRFLAFPCSLLVAVLVAAPASTQTAIKGNVLVVVSSEETIELQDGKTYKTGYFLNELAVPVKRLQEEGYAITFANPKGNKPTMDIHSDSVDFFGKDYSQYRAIKTFHDGLVNLKSPRKLADVVQDGLDRYDAVFFPGGHAPMQDLIRDPSVRQILTHFHQTGKPTALICHAPIALIAAMPQADEFAQAMRQGHSRQAAELAKDWPYKNYKMTIFSTAEEKIAESTQLQGKMLFYPQEALKSAGGDVKIVKPWNSQVVRDRELITGQNPFSDEALAETLLRAIVQKNPTK